MFAIVAILLLKFGLKMKTKIIITDAAQVKNCFELARASFVPRLALGSDRGLLKTIREEYKHSS